MKKVLEISGFICVFMIFLTSAVIAGDQTIGDNDWDILNRVELPGVDKPVYDIEYYNGSVYIGGTFTVAGNTPACGVAKWDGKKWNPIVSEKDVSAKLGKPLKIYALAFDKEGNLYIGGQFDSIGTVPARNVAKWNGTRWAGVGEGVSGYKVRSLAIDENGVLYAGGSIDSAGDVQVRNVAMWDGNRWDALGSGLYSVERLICDGKGNLYAAHQFSSIGNYKIAKWDGTSWDSLGSKMEFESKAIACDSMGNLYAFGMDHTIIQWDGQSWQNIGILHDGTIGDITDLQCNKAGELYAGGSFREVEGIQVRNIAKWNGTQWSRIGSGVKNNSGWTTISITIADSGDLFVGGSLDTAGNTFVREVAHWNGTTWNALGRSIGNLNVTINALAIEGGNYYVGGNFNQIGGIIAPNCAKWDGYDWNSFGPGMDWDIFAFCKDAKGNVYAGGRFKKAGGVEANHIAKWDGMEWSPLGAGTNDDVYALAVDSSGNLFAGGCFDSAGGAIAPRVAMWDGQTWTRLKAGMYNRNDTVFALACSKNGNLYAGGCFAIAGGCETKNIAMWNGQSWNALGTGIKRSHKEKVCALAFDRNGDLFVGGQFDTAGNIITRNIAIWNGKSWSGYGHDLRYQVNSIAIDNRGIVYVGGETVLGLDGFVKKWNRNKWEDLGSGVNRAVKVLRISNSALYVGGSFDVAGGKLSPGIAKVNIHDIPVATQQKRPGSVKNEGLAITCTNSTLLCSSVSHQDRIAVYSLSGRLLAEAKGVSVLPLKGIGPQLLLVHIYRSGIIVSTSMVIVQ